MFNNLQMQAFLLPNAVVATHPSVEMIPTDPFLLSAWTHGMNFTDLECIFHAAMAEEIITGFVGGEDCPPVWEHLVQYAVTEPLRPDDLYWVMLDAKGNPSHIANFTIVAQAATAAREEETDGGPRR